MSETPPQTIPCRCRRLASRLLAPVDIASLAVFRMAFAAIMLWEVWRYFHHGWINQYFVTPTFHFSYYGFSWLRPMSLLGMQLLFVGLGICAVGVALGALYRLSAALFCLGFTYIFLLDEARYLNHFYLVCLVSLLMTCIPAHRAWSLDAWWRPTLRSPVVAAWSLWVLRVQVGVVYVYGGIAKLNADWLAGEPVRMWVADRVEGGLLPAGLDSELFVYTLCYGGLLLDLLIVPLLLWRPTRGVAFVVAMLFHVTNSWLFQIGIFPWMMIAATTLFLPPSWPRRLLRRNTQTPRVPDTDTATGHVTAPFTPRQCVTLALLGAYVAVQLLVPLRHSMYSGNVSWTEEGHRFAWHMKLRSKKADARFFASDPASGETWEIDPTGLLAPWQRRVMASHPDMILQLAHHIAAECARRNGPHGLLGTAVEVRVEAMASLNGRPAQLLIDPSLDLAATPRSLRPAPWIIPLGNPVNAPPPPKLE